MAWRGTRRAWLQQVSAGAAAWSVASGSARAEAAKRPPNIVYILADDLGYGDLGCYGQTIIQTPRLDRMAAEGMRFTQAYAGSTVCAPSRCCLMTGLHSGHARVRGNALVPLRPEDVTVAELLQRAGYRTGLCGKWGLGEPESTGHPNRKGFDYFFGYLNQTHAHNYYPDYLWRNEARVPLPENVQGGAGWAAERARYSHDLITEEALEFVTREKEKPFFLYLAYTLPHANNERGAAKGDGMEIPDYGEYADKDWPAPQKGHAAMISRLDRDVGRVLDHLKALGLDENTIVFFSSDNGTHQEGGADPDFFKSSGPLRGHKRALYDGGIRVPLIARWPGYVPEGAVSEHVCAGWDFLPTAARLAETDAPEGLDGLSMVPALMGRALAQPKHDVLYWEFHEGGFKQAVRMGDWKAVRPSAKSSIELYVVTRDPGETNNLAAEHPELAARAEALFASCRTGSPDWPVPNL
jgi:arylsulfatase A-like enzyme